MVNQLSPAAARPDPARARPLAIRAATPRGVPPARGLIPPYPTPFTILGLMEDRG